MIKATITFLFLFFSFTAYSGDQKEISMKFGMQAVLTSVEGKGSELASIMKQASEAVSSLKGCELYVVQQSLTNENEILITEVWSSKEDHQASLINENVRALIVQAKPIIAAMEGKPAKFLGAHGL